MYHVELRQFPHNACRFNLGDDELRAVVEPWVREQFVEVGERKWSPHQARLTILEGPSLAMEELTMGRGWRAAERQSENVTQRILASATEALRQAAEAAGPTTLPDRAAAGMPDPLAFGVQIAALLGPDPMRLLEAWRVASAQQPGISPSESLARAERAVVEAEAESG